MNGFSALAAFQTGPAGESRQGPVYLDYARKARVPGDLRGDPAITGRGCIRDRSLPVDSRRSFWLVSSVITVRRLLTRPSRPYLIQQEVAEQRTLMTAHKLRALYVL